ncbi:MAG: hypothetical protein AAFX40_15465, partial [Cyanobacteria bacterium J06639_1]
MGATACSRFWLGGLLLVVASLSACGGDRSTPVAVTAVPDVAGARQASLIFSGDPKTVSLEDVALAAALQNLPVRNRDVETLAAAAANLLSSGTTIAPASLTPIPTAASTDYALPEGTLDLADVAVMLAGNRMAEAAKAELAAAATALLGSSRILQAEDVAAIPGDSFPGDRGRAGGGALVLLDDARVALSSPIVDSIDRLPSRTPSGGNLFFPPGVEIRFPTPPNTQRALRVSFKPPLMASRIDDPEPFTAEDLGCDSSGVCQLPDIAFIVPQGFTTTIEEISHDIEYRFLDRQGRETIVLRNLTITAEEPLDLASSFAEGLRSLPFIPSDDPLTTATISGITSLDLSNTNLESLRGIAVFTALQEWVANDNAIVDLAPFNDFGSSSVLRTFEMANNNLNDISPLSRSPGLNRILLSGNNISDLTP